MQDCAERPSRSLPHTEMLHYVDSQVGAQAKIQCYTESLGGSSPWSRAVCTDQGDWYTNIQCKGRINWYNWIGNVYEFFSLQFFIAHKHFVIGTRTGLELVFKLQACIKLNLFLIIFDKMKLICKFTAIYTSTSLFSLFVPKIPHCWLSFTLFLLFFKLLFLEWE